MENGSVVQNYWGNAELYKVAEAKRKKPKWQTDFLGLCTLGRRGTRKQKLYPKRHEEQGQIDVVFLMARSKMSASICLCT